MSLVVVSHVAVYSSAVYSSEIKMLSVRQMSCSENLLKTNKKANKTYFGEVSHVNSKIQSKRHHKATFILYVLNGKKVTRKGGLTVSSN